MFKVDNWTRMDSGDSDIEQFEASLPFYPSAKLIRRVDARDGSRETLYLGSVDDDRELNGASSPIHQANEEEPIRLSAENLVCYLKFFCHFVKGDEGSFEVVEDKGDPLLAPYASDEALEKLEEVKFEIAIIDGEIAYRATSYIFYGKALFISKFKIKMNGNVEMLDDEPLAALA
jgi:hypothetical protein